MYPLHAPLVLFLFYSTMYSCGDYNRERIAILEEEKRLFTGGKILITDKEIKVNEILLREKSAELKVAYGNVEKFSPARHFFNAKRDIEKSKVFSIIKKLPKGASLHTHTLAAVSVEYLLENITYRDNLYGCVINDVFKLRFLESPEQDKDHKWKSLREYREEDPNFDKWLKERLSLVVDNPLEKYPTASDVWRRFRKIFTTKYDMVSYVPVFKDYIYQLLQELYADNVVYTELRGNFMPLYELDGTRHDNKKFFEVFMQVVEKFKKENPGFLGVRYIHSISRGVTPEELELNINELVQIKSIYPQFIAGLDIVGYEEDGHTLHDYHEILQNASNQLKFFFYAGETKSYGNTDLNLLDAILLNTSRIGHGFALSKHPILVDLAKQKNIAIELCPISNQVLQLVHDFRNHPVIPLLASGFPVVICNNDPTVWNATGLSYDWYTTFMAMTPEGAGIEVLKQFALNSFEYSAMEASEKVLAVRKWSKDWENFLDDIIFNGF